MLDFIKLIYALFIGGAVAVFAAMTLSVIYPGPAYPEPDFSFSATPSEAQMKEEEEAYKKFDKELAEHKNNKAIILLALSVGVFLLGLAGRSRKFIHAVIVEGLLFGGFFIALYSALQSYFTYFPGFNDQPRMLVSVISAFVALVMVITITQLKFAALKNTSKTRKR